eukprot:14970843-Alexandrium_andersonii.AAC.1
MRSCPSSVVHVAEPKLWPTPPGARADPLTGGSFGPQTPWAMPWGVAEVPRGSGRPRAPRA